MKFTVKVRKVGNSAGILIPSALGLIGKEVEVDIPALDIEPVEWKVEEVGKKEETDPFGMCPKHGGFYKSCHC